MTSQLLYKQVEDKIRQAIASGEWQPGDRLPGENDLSAQFGVSRVTLRNAISHLVDEGILMRLHGKGTFVTSNEPMSVLRNRMTRFTERCEQQGRKATSRIVFAGLAAPDADTRHFLSLASDEEAFVLKRVRMADHIPIVVETALFRYSFLYLKEHDLTQSLYAALEEHGIYPTSSYRKIDIIYADEQVAGYLNIPKSTALLHNVTYVYDDKNQPLHTVDQICRSDLPEIFQFYV